MSDRAIKTLVAISAIVFGILLSGCFAKPDADPNTTPPPGSLAGSITERLLWQTGSLKGSAGFRLDLTSPSATECLVRLAGRGTSDHFQSTAGLVLVHSDGSKTVVVMAGQEHTSGTSSGMVKVNGQKVVDVRSQWTVAIERSLRIGPSSPASVFALAVDLDPSSPAIQPLTEIDLGQTTAGVSFDCRSAVEIIGSSPLDSPIVFDETSFEGTTVASYAPIDPNSAIIEGSLQKEISASEGQMHVMLGGDIGNIHSALGVIELTYPDGTDEIIDFPAIYSVDGTPGSGFETFSRTAGSGTYRVAATWVDGIAYMRGVMFGILPAEEKSERWTIS